MGDMIGSRISQVGGIFDHETAIFTCAFRNLYDNGTVIKKHVPIPFSDATEIDQPW